VTERVGPSIAFFSWDHIFVRHLSLTRWPGAGLVKNVRGERPPAGVGSRPAIVANSGSFHDYPTGQERMRLAVIGKLSSRGECLGERGHWWG